MYKRQTIDIKKLYDVKKDLKTKLKELEATLPFNTANSNAKYMKHVLLAEAIENMIEAKKKDHDKDGDIDSDDYMAARDKAIKKAMGKDKKVDEAINQILWCKENDSYPDYTPNEIKTISLPPWMTKKSEQQSSQEEIELY